MNAPPAIYFIVREWSRFICDSTWVDRATNALLLYAPTGGTCAKAARWASLTLSPKAATDPEAALGATYADLVAKYKKAGREAELEYTLPDMSAFITACLAK